MFSIRLAGVGMAVLAAAGAVLAQVPHAGQPTKPPAKARTQILGKDRLKLLQLEVVATDLNLTDEQTESIKRISDAAGRKLAELRALPLAERIPKLNVVYAEIDAGIDGVLNKGQLARLKEIVVQWISTLALPNTLTADTLALTDEQKEKVLDLSRDRMNAIHNAIVSSAGDRAAARVKIAAIVRDVNAKRDALLTPGQLVKFDKMRGKQLDLGEVAWPVGFNPRPTVSLPEPGTKPDAK